MLYDNFPILKDNPNSSNMDFLKGFNLLTYDKNEVVGYRASLSFNSKMSPLNIKMSLSMNPLKQHVIGFTKI